MTPSRTPDRARVRVVVVNHNGGSVTLRCLDALARTEWPADLLDVVLVDNASTDGVLEDVRRTHPDVTVIASAENEGFGRACNRAMADLTGVDHVALINNDAVPEPGWLAPLVDALDADAGLGAVCPKVLLATRAWGVVVTQTAAEPAVLTVGDFEIDGQPSEGRPVPDERFRPALGGPPDRWSTRRTEAGVWWPAVDPSRPPTRVTLSIGADRPTDVSLASGADDAKVSVTWPPIYVTLPVPTRPEDVINSVGGILYEGWYGGDRGYLELDRGQYDEPAEVFSWSGAAVLLRVGYLRDVGLFNPAFFLYYEDFELSWRGQLKGWRYRTLPSSVVRHEHGYTTSIGSQRFYGWEERGRWMTLVELAPRRAALRASLDHARVVARNRVRRSDDIGDGVASSLSGSWKALRVRWITAKDRRSAPRLERWICLRPGRP